MLAWPLTTPEPAPLTIAKSAPLPQSYWQAVVTGRWPRQYWLATPEPTSDAIDGVALHALATPGAATSISGLPATWFPIAVNGEQIFAVATDGAIYYRDLEVDQQLRVAASWDDLVTKLQWRAPSLNEPFSQQELAHALLVADAKSLPPLLEILREQADWPVYCQWLAYLVQQAPAVIHDEAQFARDFLPLTPTQRRQLETL